MPTNGVVVNGNLKWEVADSAMPVVLAILHIMSHSANDEAEATKSNAIRLERVYRELSRFLGLTQRGHWQDAAYCLNSLQSWVLDNIRDETLLAHEAAAKLQTSLEGMTKLNAGLIERNERMATELGRHGVLEEGMTENLKPKSGVAGEVKKVVLKVGDQVGASHERRSMSCHCRTDMVGCPIHGMKDCK